MFYLKTLHSFRDQEYKFQYPTRGVGNYFIFLEDSDNIVDIHGKPYQHHTEDLQPIGTVVLAAPTLVPELMVTLLIQLQTCLKYKSIVYNGPYAENERDVFFGKADFLLEPTIVPKISLFQTFEISSRIWVKDMPYAASDTFFLKSFTPNLWLSFASIFLFLLVISLLLSKMVAFYKKYRIESFDVISLILDQGVEQVSPVWSHKILLFSLATLLIIFFCGFGAFLSSILSVRTISLPFYDYDTLLTQNEYSLCLAKFKRQTFFEMKKQQNDIKIELENNSKFCSETVYKINYLGTDSYSLDDIDCEIGKVVLLTAGRSPRFRKFSRHCNVFPLPRKLRSDHTAIVCHPGFKHRETFNRMLVLFRTAGVLQNNFKRSDIILNMREQPVVKNHSDLNPILFVQVRLILLILLGGYALSIIILMIEMMWGSVGAH